MINKERKIDLFIKYGKISVTTFIIVVVIVMISLYAHWWKEIVKNDKTDDYPLLASIVKIEGYAFLGTFIIMAVISTVLILMIREKNRILNQNA